LKTDKKLVLDIVLFAIVIATALILIVLKQNEDEQPVTRMDAVGYSIGDSTPEETTITTTESTTPVTTTTVTTVETTIATTTEEVITTTAPLVEDVIDHSNIKRASLPAEHCSDVVNLKSQNPDTRGWISLSNTSISYAFTQGQDNDYYLEHDFNGNESSSGWVFMDCNATFDDNGQQSDVITFYGHNMANGSMFATLKKYRDNADFYETNPIITLSSTNGYKYYKIFAYMVCNGLSGSDFEFWKYTNFNSVDDFNYYVSSAFRKSKIITGVDVQYGDKIIALSTCNSGSSSNHDRFVVLARMVRDGEEIYSGCYRVR
jgi:sortase B